MSYWIETEKGEVESCSADSYVIECPYCNKEIEMFHKCLGV